MTARTAIRRCREKRIIYNLSVRSPQVKDATFFTFRETVNHSVFFSKMAMPLRRFGRRDRWDRWR